MLASDPRLERYLTQQAIANLKTLSTLRSPRPARLEYAFEAERQLIADGVPILAGTDAPGPGTWLPSVSVHRELELLVRGGMSPTQALKAATSVPAAIFHLSDRRRVGRKGFRADLLLVEGDPTRDVAATRAIVGVWKLGVPVDRAAFRADVAKSRAEVYTLRHAPPPAGSVPASSAILRTARRAPHSARMECCDRIPGWGFEGVHECGRGWRQRQSALPERLGRNCLGRAISGRRRHVLARRRAIGTRESYPRRRVLASG